MYAVLKEFDRTALAAALLCFIISGCLSCNPSGRGKGPASAEVWLTNMDQSAILELQEKPLEFVKMEAAASAIEVSPELTFQTMDGFGFTLTGGSATLIHNMEDATRNKLLNELFSTEGEGINISYLRVSIGASDLNEFVFSYNDLPSGGTDLQMEKFSLDHDRVALIPVLKEILEISPDIKILGSPWSPPVWMKTNKDTRGGSLMPEYYDAYALYFVRYVQDMKAEGIRIDAITVQNEPLHPGNNPSLLMLAKDQADFIKNHLGPAFEKAGIDTKIILYDHNADRPDYPMSILEDEEAAKYVDGSAFHLYNGEIEALSEVHNAFPEKHIYFTEQWVGAPGDFSKNFSWHTRELIIGATRNWSRNVLEWNLAADPNQDPHTDRGGCDRCLGALTIDQNNVTRNVAYYIIAQVSKFVPPGSVRIFSGLREGLNNVAFKTPENKIVLLVQNDDSAARTFEISCEGKTAKTTLEGGSVATFVW